MGDDQVARAVAEERRKIASELHDFALQEQAVALMRIDDAKHLLETGQLDEAVRVLDEAARAVRTGIRAARMIMLGETPALFEHLTLADALHAAADAIEHDHGLRVERAIEITADVRGELQQVVHRLVMEALRNAGKHAAAGVVQLEVWHDGNCLHAFVQDDGRGFAEPFHVRNQPSDAMGYGMASALQQVIALDGTYEVRSTPGDGTLVRISVPLSAEAA